MSLATVAGLYLYPVKSLAGIVLTESMVERHGLRHDRRWMLVDSDGVFITQRDNPELALFKTAIGVEGLRLTSPSGEQVSVPFRPTGVMRTVRVQKDTCEGIQVSDELDAWFSHQLGAACSLVFMPEDCLRQTNLKHTQDGDRVGFADAYPVLVLGQASLDELNARLADPVPINRFRPNVLVTGWAPHEEDAFAELRTGDVAFRAAKRCGRCSIVSTDQATAMVGVEPLRTLAKYRLSEQKIYFGAYFVPVSVGRIAIGDDILSTVASTAA